MKARADLNNFTKYALLLIVSVLGLYIRYLGRDALSVDFQNCLDVWYQEIVGAGPGIDSLLAYTGDYALPYAFLIWLLSKLPIPFLYSLKMMHTIFDFGMAVLVGLIAQQFKPENKNIFCWGYCVTLLLPNVFMNSSFWGQCDVIYTFFLLASLLCFFRKKYIPMMILFGVAFAFKMQSVFLLPFILIAYWLKKEFSILHFLFIPASMFVMNIPAMAAGYPPMTTFTQYVIQANGYPWLYYFYPNLYFFFQARPYYLFSTGAMMLTVAALLIFVVLLIEKKVSLDQNNILPILLWTTYTCVFFLPSMHERYGYFAEIIAVIVGLVNIRKSWIACGMILCVIPKYLFAVNFVSNPISIQMVTAVGNTLVYTVFTCILWHQLFQRERRTANAAD